jgi:hypothetical protein
MRNRIRRWVFVLQSLSLALKQNTQIENKLPKLLANRSPLGFSGRVRAYAHVLQGSLAKTLVRPD